MDRTKWTINRKPGTYACIRVPEKRDLVPVIGIGDLHYGHPNCRIDIIKRAIKWVQDNDALVIGMGDWMENSTKLSVGSGVYEQIASPKRQIDDLVEMFSPISSHFIGFIKGNHEIRTEVISGIDPANSIAQQLDIPYFNYEFFGIVASDRDARRKCVRIYATHSGSGHKSSGLAFNQVQRDWRFTNADLVMKAHDHHLGYDADTTNLVFNTSNVKIMESRLHIVLTGSTLARPDSYAARKPHPPNRLGFMPVMLNIGERRNDKDMPWSVRPIYNDLQEG